MLVLCGGKSRESHIFCFDIFVLLLPGNPDYLFLSFLKSSQVKIGPVYLNDLNFSRSFKKGCFLFTITDS